MDGTNAVITAASTTDAPSAAGVPPGAAERGGVDFDPRTGQSAHAGGSGGGRPEADQSRREAGFRSEARQEGGGQEAGEEGSREGGEEEGPSEESHRPARQEGFQDGREQGLQEAREEASPQGGEEVREAVGPEGFPSGPQEGTQAGQVSGTEGRTGEAPPARGRLSRFRDWTS